jgi:hypothetical protein
MNRFPAVIAHLEYLHVDRFDPRPPRVIRESQLRSRRGRRSR